VRGIEIRRCDSPRFIKDFQTGLISTLFDCNDTKGIMKRGYEDTLLLVTKEIDKIMLGGDEVRQEDLIISKLLGQDIMKYRILFPHVNAVLPIEMYETSKDNGILASIECRPIL
jgi:DNA polymerase elongation subunit (family B)